VEEERAKRVEVVSEQVKVFRAMLPLLLVQLSKISDLTDILAINSAERWS
jgi:hypothetical protein